jgi:hypothetical protein
MNHTPSQYQRVCNLSGFGQIARCDCGDGDKFAVLHCGQNFLQTNLGGGKDTPRRFLLMENDSLCSHLT